MTFVAPVGSAAEAFMKFDALQRAQKAVVARPYVPMTPEERERRDAIHDKVRDDIANGYYRDEEN